MHSMSSQRCRVNKNIGIHTSAKYAHLRDQDILSSWGAKPQLEMTSNRPISSTMYLTTWSGVQEMSLPGTQISLRCFKEISADGHSCQQSYSYSIQRIQPQHPEDAFCFLPCTSSCRKVAIIPRRAHHPQQSRTTHSTENSLTVSSGDHK